MKGGYDVESFAEAFDRHNDFTGAIHPDGLAAEFRGICEDADAEISALKADRDYLYDGLNKILHPNGDGPERPSGCDLLAFLESDLRKLREERGALLEKSESDQSDKLTLITVALAGEKLAKATLSDKHWHPTLKTLAREMLVSWAENPERARLEKEREAADALADAVSYAKDLMASADFLRERMEEIRQSVGQPWKMQIDEYTAAVKELANRHTAFDELYECSEYTGWYQMIQDAEAAYRKVRDAG